MRRILFLISFFAADLALADQCAWISAEEAQRAKVLLERTTEGTDFCELCDQKKPELVRIREVEVKTAGDKYKEIFINGKPYDMAYFFIATGGQGKYENMSKLIGCKSDGVSRVIRIQDGEVVKDDAEDWTGLYGKRPVFWVLTNTSGPAYRIELDYGTNENGNDRGTLQGSAELAGGKLRMRAPFPKCVFEISRPDPKTIKVLPTKSCGLLGQHVSGTFSAQ